MKYQKSMILWLLLAALLLFLVAEILLRPQVFFNSLGSELYSLKQYSPAAKLFSRFGSKSTPSMDANSAKALYKKGEKQSAEEAANSSLSKKPDNPSVHYDKGNMAFSEKDYESAIKHYQDALLINPNDKDTKENLELALKKQKQNPQPKPEQDDKQQDQNKEEVRNILEALDNKESRDRKDSKPSAPPKANGWW